MPSNLLAVFWFCIACMILGLLAAVPLLHGGHRHRRGDWPTDNPLFRLSIGLLLGGGLFGLLLWTDAAVVPAPYLAVSVVQALVGVIVSIAVWRATDEDVND